VEFLHSQGHSRHASLWSVVPACPLSTVCDGRPEKCGLSRWAIFGILDGKKLLGGALVQASVLLINHIALRRRTPLDDEKLRLALPQNFDPQSYVLNWPNHPSREGDKTRGFGNLVAANHLWFDFDRGDSNQKGYASIKCNNASLAPEYPGNDACVSSLANGEHRSFECAHGAGNLQSS
jgi:hypothetical protein